jgi:hypothetical protein
MSTYKHDEPSSSSRKVSGFAPIEVLALDTPSDHKRNESLQTTNGPQMNIGATTGKHEEQPQQEDRSGII